MEVGKRTMKLQCDFIIDDYYQWMVGDKHLRADGLGQQWKFYLIKEPVTEEEKIQQAEVKVTKSGMGPGTRVSCTNNGCQ